MMDQNFATKAEFSRLELATKSEFQRVELSLRSEMKDLHYKTITTLGSLMTALIGVAVAILEIH